MWVQSTSGDGRFVVRKLLRRNEQAGHLRFLTFSCYRCLPLFSNDLIKRAFVQTLETGCLRAGSALVAWVIMPDHVHLLILPPRDDRAVRSFLHAIKRLFARQVIARWKHLDAPILERLGDTPRFWQPGGGHDRIVESDQEASNDIDYIHENPVVRGLVDRAIDWKWSSARHYARLSYDGPPIARIED